jgi:hypothetical protein
MPTTLQELHDLLKNNEPDDPGYNGPKLGLTNSKVFVNETSWILTFTPDDGYIDIVTKEIVGDTFSLTRNGVCWKAPKDTIVTKYSITFDNKWINCD